MSNDRSVRAGVIVSNDTHVGPRLVEDLRPYCPASHLDEFDRFAAETAEPEASGRAALGGQRLPRPSELPHRRPPRLRGSARRLRP